MLPGNDLRQVVYTYVPLSPSSIIWYRLHRWHLNRHTARYTGPVSTSCSVKTGVWLRAKETDMSAAQWASRLGKGLNVNFYLKVKGGDIVALNVKPISELRSVTCRIRDGRLS